MENLIINSIISCKFIDINKKYNIPICYYGDMIYIGNYNKIICLIKKLNKYENKFEVSLNLSCNDFIIGIEFIENINTLVMLSDSGLVIFWENIPNDEPVIKFEVDCDCKIMSFSSNRSLFVICGLKKVYIWEINIDVIYKGDFDLYIDNINDLSVNVGWGQKETQFKGRGKQLSEKINDKILSCDNDNVNDKILSGDNVNDKILSGDNVNDKILTLNDENKEIIISWRKDNLFLAISFIDELDNKRKIYVFSNTGEFISKCKNIDILCPVLSWSPNNYWITSIIKNKLGYKLINFERNGLERCVFNLNISLNYNIIKLSWNETNDILVVLIKDINYKILLYTLSNFHLYLKFEIVQHDILDYFIQFNQLIIILSDNVLIYNFKHDFISNLSNNISLTTVIDGYYVYFTPFGKTFIPPPLSLCSCRLPFISSCTLILDECNTLVYDELSKNLIKINIDITLKGSVEPYNERGCTQIIYKPHIDYIENCRLLTFIKFINIENNNILSLIYNNQTKSNELVSITLCSNEYKFNKIKIFDKNILTISNVLQNIIIYQDSDHQLYQLFIIDSNVIHLDIIHKPIKSIFILKTNPILFLTLTTDGDLFINHNKIFNYCTRFYITNSFLLILVNKCKLIFIPIADIKVDFNQNHNYLYRNLESGSIVITIIEFNNEIILQLPRGNIEIIYPRAFVLNNFMEKFNNFQFNDAFILLKRHRIDYNLFFDYNPKVFIEKIDQIINDINSSDSIIKLLNEINDQNISYKLLQSFNPSYFCNFDHWEQSKLVTITSCIRESCMKIDLNKYRFVILLTFLKQPNNAIESALNYILYDLSSEKPDRYLDFLKLYIQSDLLYKKALSTYNLQLVILVAQITDKDPKEYIQYIKYLQSFSIPYRNFIIEKDLNNFNKAFDHLIRCENKADEIIQFIKTYSIYEYAFKSSQNNSDIYPLIANEYALYLQSKKKYYDSALIYLQIQSYNNAFIAFCIAGNYQFSLLALDKSDISTELRNTHLKILINNLKEQNLYNYAADISQKYFDIEYTFNILFQGRLWCRAYCLIQIYQSFSLYFNENLISRYKILVNNISTYTKDINQKLDRLVSVREIRQNNYNNQHSLYYESECSSDTSSISSRSSNKSKKTKKKKSKNKYYQDKIGGKYEEFAILNTFYNIYHSALNDLNEISHIIPLLSLNRQYQQDAYELSRKSIEFKSILLQNYKLIWIPTLNLGPLQNHSIYLYDNEDINNMPILNIPNYQDYQSINIPIF